MAFLKPDKVFDFGGVTVNEYLLTQHNPNKIDMPKTSMEGKVIGVTVHNTGWILVSSSTTPAEQYTRATVNGNMNDVRVHYYVDDVCAWQNLPLTLKGWHAADGQGDGNCKTVAIECIMSAKYNEKDKKSEDNCAKLAAALLKKFGLGINSLYTHSHWMNVRDGKKGTVDELNVMPNRTKNCPAYILPHWQQFKALVAKYLGEPISTQPTTPAKTEPATGGKLSSLYRIRKTWEDAKSQIGAYTILNNAVNACLEGYSVFDLDGVVVFTNRGKSDKTNPYPEYKSTLRKGDKGDGVKWLQWELVDRGYNCGDTGVDGSFGGKTERGVKAFQEANGLDIDGVCGPMTRAAIEATAKHPVKPDFTPRYTKPEKGNPYYNTISNGGYSRAIKGKPTDPDCDVLANCVGYSFARFHEIANCPAMNLFDPVNAENIFANAQKHGLKTGNTPKLGAMIVWQKGATLSGSDGAGHVAVVEEIGIGGEIVTSESGYGATKPFWNGSYKPPYNYKSGYKFLGFVYQPE